MFHVGDRVVWNGHAATVTNVYEMPWLATEFGTFGVKIVSTDKMNGVILKVEDGRYFTAGSRESAQDIADYKNRHEGGFYKFEVFEFEN